MSFKIADIDFIFLSFDEPNGEKNFANLRKYLGQRESMGYMDLMRRIKPVLRRQTQKDLLQWTVTQ